jgi:CBS domain containing-hemolysin-like protein
MDKMKIVSLIFLDQMAGPTRFFSYFLSPLNQLLVFSFEWVERAIRERKVEVESQAQSIQG